MNECIELIHRFGKPKGIVLDPFAGTMKNTMAAIRLQMRSISIEKDVAIVPHALLRLKSWYSYVNYCFQNKIMCLPPRKQKRNQQCFKPDVFELEERTLLEAVQEDADKDLFVAESSIAYFSDKGT